MAGDTDTSPLKCQTIQRDGVIEHICSAQAAPVKVETEKPQPNNVVVISVILAIVVGIVLVRKFIGPRRATSRFRGKSKGPNG
jgi:hypothetical protein